MPPCHTRNKASLTGYISHLSSTSESNTKTLSYVLVWSARNADIVECGEDDQRLEWSGVEGGVEKPNQIVPSRHRQHSSKWRGQTGSLTRSQENMTD